MIVTLKREDWLKFISAAFTGKDGDGEPQVVEAIIDDVEKQLAAAE